MSEKKLIQQNIKNVQDSFNILSQSLELSNKSGSFTLEQSSSTHKSLTVLKQICKTSILITHSRKDAENLCNIMYEIE